MPYVTITTEVETEENIDCYCECGEPICDLVTVKDTDRGRSPRFIIQPCEKCIKAAKEEGYDEGYDKGYEKGKDVGYDLGRESYVGEEE
jgi:hypothetical protein